MKNISFTSYMHCYHGYCWFEMSRPRMQLRDRSSIRNRRGSTTNVSYYNSSIVCSVVGTTKSQARATDYRYRHHSRRVEAVWTPVENPCNQHEHLWQQCHHRAVSMHFTAAWRCSVTGQQWHHYTITGRHAQGNEISSCNPSCTDDHQIRAVLSTSSTGWSISIVLHMRPMKSWDLRLYHRA